MNFAQNLIHHREKYELSQADLAIRAGVSRSLITQFETGLKIPSLVVAVKIADALNVSVDELVGRKVG